MPFRVMVSALPAASALSRMTGVVLFILTLGRSVTALFSSVILPLKSMTSSSIVSPVAPEMMTLYFRFRLPLLSMRNSSRL